MEDTSTPEVTDDTSQEPEVTTEEPSTPEEEPQLETPQMYAGKYKSPEELEKAYTEAQRKLSEQGAIIAEANKPQRPEDEQALIEQMKALGMVTKEDLQRQQAVNSQAAKDDLEISALNLTDAQVSILRKTAAHPDNLEKGMTEIWDELSGAIGGTVVSRKTTVKPKSGNKTGFVEKSQAEVAALAPADYDKYWADYRANKAA